MLVHERLWWLYRSVCGGELPDLKLILAVLFVLLNVDVDREMGVDVSHFVFVALCYACDQVLDDRFDCSEGCDIFAGAVVDFDLDNVLLR